jgi:hypothetical protein
MHRPACLLLVALFIGCRVGGPLQGAACVVDPAAVRPLRLGDSVRLATARLDRMQCRAPDATPYRWALPAAADSAVAHVRPDGWVIARQVGPFRVEGRADTLLVVEGFVLPAGWRPRLRPAARRVGVGDTLWVAVDAVDARGRPLPWVPFDVATGDDIQFLSQGEAPRPMKLRVLGPATPARGQPFLAAAPGRVVLRGYIGAQRDTAWIDVAPQTSGGAI